MKKITRKQFKDVLDFDTELRNSSEDFQEKDLGTIRINSYYVIEVTKITAQSGRKYYELDVINTRKGGVPNTYSVRETLDRALFKSLVYDIVDKYDDLFEKESEYAHIYDLYEILDPEDLYNELEIETEEEFVEYFLNNKDAMLYNLIYMLREERGF